MPHACGKLRSAHRRRELRRVGGGQDGRHARARCRGVGGQARGRGTRRHHRHPGQGGSRGDRPAAHIDAARSRSTAACAESAPYRSVSPGSFFLDHRYCRTCCAGSRTRRCAPAPASDTGRGLRARSATATASVSLGLILRRATSRRRWRALGGGAALRARPQRALPGGGRGGNSRVSTRSIRVSCIASSTALGARLSGLGGAGPAPDAGRPGGRPRTTRQPFGFPHPH